MSYSRQPNPVWLFTDLVGNILDDNYYISFLENTIPYLPQPVYHDDQGATPWANPLQFHPDGTLPDNLYFQDGAVYRLEIRRGPTQSDPLIRLIENFTAANSDDPTNISLPIDNQITNPQFALLSFEGPYVISNTGTNSYDIAPGWVLDLVSTGAAVMTLERIAIAGDENIPFDTPTNPSYALSFEVTSGVFTSVQLRQRFDHAPAIWASEGISINFTGKVLNNSANILVRYVPSNGTDTTIIADTLTTVYQFIAGGAQLPPSDSIDTGDNGYVDIVFTLPIIGTTFITNVQVLGSAQAATYPYAQTTVERQIDQTFHYYRDSLLRQAKGNILVGWTFAQNPWQFRPTALTTIAAQTDYIADQTILHQETAGALQSGKGGGGVNFGLQLFAINGVDDNRFALISYLDYKSVWAYFGQILSSLARAAIVTTHSTQTKLKMRLIYRTAGDAIPAYTNIEPITGWDADGNLTFAAGWTAVSPLNDPAYTLQELVDTNFPGMPFEQFQLPEAPSSTPYLGVVLYITEKLNNTLGTEDAVAFDRVSLLPNDFAMDAEVESFDETLRRCQYYYETSYSLGSLEGTAVTAKGQQTEVIPLWIDWTGGVLGNNSLYRKAFRVNFKTVKRSSPLMNFYSPASNAAGNIQAVILFGDNTISIGPVNDSTAGGTNKWTTINENAVDTLSEYSVDMYPINNAIITDGVTTLTTGASQAQQGIINYHYSANSLLGI